MIPIPTPDAAYDDLALERLRRFGGAELLREMVALFVGHAPARVAAARSALEHGETEGVRAALHSLRSSAAQLGASPLQALCAEGEALAASGAAAALPALVARIEEEMSRSCAWLQRATVAREPA